MQETQTEAKKLRNETSTSNNLTDHQGYDWLSLEQVIDILDHVEHDEDDDPEADG